jgi:hypothetical protein
MKTNHLATLNGSSDVCSIEKVSAVCANPNPKINQKVFFAMHDFTGCQIFLGT